MKKHSSGNTEVVLNVLHDEINGDTKSALNKLGRNYTMTWVYKRGKKIFPSTKQNFKKAIKEIYKIKGREYDIRNIAEGKGVVMVELIESYPDTNTKKIYRTPLVLVLEMKGGKIQRGRHYCDPTLSFMYLSKKEIAKVYTGTKSKVILR